MLYNGVTIENPVFLRQKIIIVTLMICMMPHQEYKHLGTTNEQRESAYRQLFHSHISDMTLEAIREATNKAQVLGNDSFKNKIEKTLNRPAVSRGQGGDRKSKAYRQRNLRV